jgi:hypothetical protein
MWELQKKNNRLFREMLATAKIQRLLNCQFYTLAISP